MSTLTHADDAATFEREVLQSEVPTVVDFWATWCPPCKMVAPELEALAADRDDVKVVKVDIDEYPEVATRYGVMSIPTIVLFKDGAPVVTSVGAKSRRALEVELGLLD